MPPSHPAPEDHPDDDRTTERTTDLIRWAAFSCVLVPVVLLWYGTSFAGAAGTALGLAAVTGACRLLLRRSERYAHETRDLQEPQQPPESPGSLGSPESHKPQDSQVTRGAQASYGPRRGRRHRPGGGPRRGGRHSGGSSPVG
ncbi:hypothetical protein [Streptomyces sp. NPDC002328]|uniref:hypothetical protein n=1 Tax=Streptomyces sp. NPDC002328 TaxID=3364642 RepID=UPI0036B9FE62